MTTKRWLALFVLGCLAAPAWSINMALSRLVGEDQADRRSMPTPDEWPAIAARDHERRRAVLQMLREGQLTEAIDFENAALVFQHGVAPQEYQLAHALATVAAAMDPDRRGARSLKRLTWDRYMLSLGRGQWFDSQQRHNRQTGAAESLPADSTVTDAMRLSFDSTEPLVKPPR